MTSHTLLPSLSALLPPTSYTRFLSHLSLQSLHVEPYYLIEHVYTCASTILPGQLRSLRVRQKRRNSKPAGTYSGVDGRGRAEIKYEYDYSVMYLSPPLSGREYADMSVRACIQLQVAGCETEEEVRDFVQTLGFQYSHSYTRTGLLFHLPLPSPASHMTLHLTVTRLLSTSTTPPKSDPIRGSAQGIADASAPSSSTAETLALSPLSDEPYLVHLEPCHPVPAVNNPLPNRNGRIGATAMANPNAQPSDPGLQDMMELIQTAAGRIEGVRWETGRAP